MKELSIFVDESGDFGAYSPHSPYYIITFVFHDRNVDITENIEQLNTKVKNAGLPNYTIHTGPLIRRENEYLNLSLLERKWIFNILYNFTRAVDIKYCSLIIEKKRLLDKIDLNIQITKKLSAFLNIHMEYFINHDKIVVYYDYGQMELTKTRLV